MSTKMVLEKLKAIEVPVVVCVGNTKNQRGIFDALTDELAPILFSGDIPDFRVLEYFCELFTEKLELPASNSLRELNNYLENYPTVLVKIEDNTPPLVVRELP